MVSRLSDTIVSPSANRFFLLSGVIREGESFLVGPLTDGTFLPAKVTTIHRYRVPRRLVRAGQAASLSLPHIEASRLRKVNLSPSLDSTRPIH